MIPTINTIEVRETNQKESLIFKYIGQILKAYVQEKISERLYSVKFSKGSILVQSNLALKEREPIFLRVESLRPKIILKQLPDKALDSTNSKKALLPLGEKPSLWKLLKASSQSEPEIRSILKIILNPKKITEKIFWDNIRRLFYHLDQDTSFHYLNFIKAVNNHIEGLYLQLTSFYSVRDIEIYFELKKNSVSKNRRCIIHINLELSFIGPVNVIIEEEKSIEIKFKVKGKNTQDIIKKHFSTLKNRLKDLQPSKDIHMDCKIMPDDYWDKVFHINIINQQNDGFVDLVA